MRRRFRFHPPVVGSNRFSNRRHASNGFFRELATMSFASQLVSTTNAVCICCNKLPVLYSSVHIGIRRPECCRRDFRRLFSCHSNIISDSLITTSEDCIRLVRPELKILFLAREFLLTTKAFHIDETRSVFPNLSCREIVDRRPASARPDAAAT